MVAEHKTSGNLTQFGSARRQNVRLNHLKKKITVRKTHHVLVKEVVYAFQKRLVQAGHRLEWNRYCRVTLGRGRVGTWNGGDDEVEGDAPLDEPADGRENWRTWERTRKR